MLNLLCHVGHTPHLHPQDIAGWTLALVVVLVLALRQGVRS